MTKQRLGTAIPFGEPGTTQSGAHQQAYRLDPPLEGHKRVVVSAVNAWLSGPETYIFPADAKGEIKDFGELQGSRRGTLSHVLTLKGAGYRVVRDA